MKKLYFQISKMDPAGFNDAPVPPVFSAPVPPVFPDTDVEDAGVDVVSIAESTKFVTELVTSQVRGWMVCIIFYFF